MQINQYKFCTVHMEIIQRKNADTFYKRKSMCHSYFLELSRKCCIYHNDMSLQKWPLHYMDATSAFKVGSLWKPYWSTQSFSPTISWLLSNPTSWNTFIGVLVSNCRSQSSVPTDILFQLLKSKMTAFTPVCLKIKGKFKR